MDADERARLRALRETIPDGDVTPCCGRAGQDGHHSSWALGMMPHGAALRAWVAGPLDLLALARTALPALLDDSERLDARIAKAERERDEAVAMLRNLLARVHRDGGQHSDAVGLAQATEEADEIIARAFAELARLRAPRPSAIVLRPVDPMPLRGLPCACDEWGPGHLDGCPNGDAEPVDAPVPWDDEDMALADGDRRALDVVTRERDEARAEAERLRRELAETRGDFAQMREDRDALKGALARANELRIGDRAEARLDERWACSEFAEKWLREVGEITQDTPADLADAIRARGAGGAR